jgi:hypothetical protein
MLKGKKSQALVRPESPNSRRRRSLKRTTMPSRRLSGSRNSSDVIACYSYFNIALNFWIPTYKAKFNYTLSYLQISIQLVYFFLHKSFETCSTIHMSSLNVVIWKMANFSTMFLIAMHWQGTNMVFFTFMVPELCPFGRRSIYSHMLIMLIINV